MEEHRLRVSENRVLRKMFGLKGDMGGWRRLQIEKLYNVYASPNISRVNESRRFRWADNVEFMRELGCAHTILVGKPGGKKPLGRPGRRQEEIK